MLRGEWSMAGVNPGVRDIISPRRVAKFSGYSS
jgi:hypothetical protein